MKQNLEVLFSPAEFASLPQRDLSNTVCVVFDVLRATSTMLQALSVGAAGITPAGTIEEAVALGKEHPDWLLAGERHGLRITSALSGGRDFDLGNSPREFLAGKVAGKTIVTTTTNGTRALRASRNAAEVLVAAYVNVDAVAARLANEKSRNLILVCSGTNEEAAYEDTLAAGALCEALLTAGYQGAVADSAHIAATVFQAEKSDLMAAMQRANNGSRLLNMPDLKDDVAFCLRRNAIPLLAVMSKGGVVTKLA